MTKIMYNVRKFWEQIANDEPYYGVLTQSKFLKSNFISNEDEYWQSGSHDLKYIFGLLSRNTNIKPEQLNDANIIEIGIGTARIASHTIQYCNKIYGIDISEKYLAIAYEKLESTPFNNFELVNYNAFYNTNFENVKLIYSFITLQHNPPSEIKKIIEHVCKVLSQNGCALLHIPYDVCNRRYKYHDACTMQMNIVPKDEIEHIVRDSGCILDIVECSKCGPRIKDAIFIIKKD